MRITASSLILSLVVSVAILQSSTHSLPVPASHPSISRDDILAGIISIEPPPPPRGGDPDYKPPANAGSGGATKPPATGGNNGGSGGVTKPPLNPPGRPITTPGKPGG
ncbi:hypothetical protein BGZ89_000937, partial [Linnemannia elongata]